MKHTGFTVALLICLTCTSGWLFGGGEEEKPQAANDPQDDSTAGTGNIHGEADPTAAPPSHEAKHETFADFDGRYAPHPETEHEHYDEEGEHNEIYDAEAFLGYDLSDETLGYSEDDAKELLENIFKDKLDGNHDQQADLEEMVSWLSKVRDHDMEKDAESKWTNQPIVDDHLTWESYTQSEYPDSEGELSSSEKFRKQNDHARFLAADTDKDERLSVDEFKRLVHPELYDSMRTVVIDEVMHELDTDRDGKLSREEFLADLAPDETERAAETFATNDRDQSSYLDTPEVTTWLYRDDAIRAEAVHLIAEADDDKDGALSLQEMHKAYQIFTKSGHEYQHDEL